MKFWNKLPLTTKFIVGALFVLVLFASVLFWKGRISYVNALERGGELTQKLIEVQSDHIKLTINSAHLSLQGLAEKRSLYRLFYNRTPKNLKKTYKNLVYETPQIASFLIANTRGQIREIYSKRSYSGWEQSQDISKQNFYTYHLRNNMDGELYIGISELNANLIMLSIPTKNIEGRFDGIMAIAIDSSYFFDYAQSGEFGANVALAIILKHQKKIIESHADDYSKNRTELDLSSILAGQLNMVINSREEYTSLKANTGDKNYIFAYKDLQDYPIVVALNYDEDSILKDWYSSRNSQLVFLLLFVFFTGILLYFISAMVKHTKKAEASEQKALLANQSKSEFLAKMSHELRTPLNAIIGFSEMIQAGYFGKLTNKLKERVKDINLCGSHLLELINDILDYSKAEAGKLDLNEANVDIERVIDDAVRMVKENAQDKNIKLDVDVEHGMPMLYLDERKTKQVLINLLTNAVKFTQDGGKVAIKANLENGRAKLVVSDNGKGMNADDIPRALSVFGQVHNEQMHEGTGLGLPLCKMLTELHGGKLDIDSEKDKGTKVTIILPRSRVMREKVLV